MPFVSYSAIGCICALSPDSGVDEGIEARSYTWILPSDEMVLMIVVDERDECEFDEGRRMLIVSTALTLSLRPCISCHHRKVG